MSESLVEHTIKSIENATKHISDIDDTILSLDGMSSPKVRHLLNNITKLENCNYFEIGCWKGSTIISALFKNSVKNHWVVDDFSMFSGTKDEFIKNFTSILGYSPNLIDKDFTSFNPSKDYGIKDVNVYFYDGDHEDYPQGSALSHCIDSFQDEFIYICDDWNGWRVAKMTKDTIHSLKLEILYEKILPAKFNGDKELWWNGLYVSVLKKEQ